MKENENHDGGGGWTVHPHGPLEALAENLWRVQGSLPKISLKRQMIVARRTDGTLVVHNAIRQEPGQQAELEARGAVSAIVVPNGWHRLDAPAYKRKYPTAKVYAPAGGRSKVETRLSVDGTYADFPADDAVRLESLPGINDAEGVMLVTSSDGVTVVLNDLVFNMDKKSDLMGRLTSKILGTSPGPRVGRHVRLFLVKDKPALRARFEELASLPRLIRVIVAHEKVAHGQDARDVLLKACTYL